MPCFPLEQVYLRTRKDQELRRSGRVKSKSPVVEENTVLDAYSVDDESSGDDFVDGNGKGIDMGHRVAKRGSGSNVSRSS
ncbi:hypothetical protein Tco_0230641, partial [Tanacetum coccineum]